MKKKNLLHLTQAVFWKIKKLLRGFAKSADLARMVVMLATLFHGNNSLPYRMSVKSNTAVKRVCVIQTIELLFKMTHISYYPEDILSYRPALLRSCQSTCALLELTCSLWIFFYFKTTCGRFGERNDFGVKEKTKKQKLISMKKNLLYSSLVDRRDHPKCTLSDTRTHTHQF